VTWIFVGAIYDTKLRADGGNRGSTFVRFRLLLGHSTLLMTQRYLNVSDDDFVTAMSEEMWKRA
jgi:hypothetical protein